MAFDAPRRPLVYPLKNQLSLSAETPDGETIESDFVWATEDNDERVLITLELSLNEYIVLASSIDVGSDIAYGRDATAVWWLWARAYRMSICEQIIQCINENEATQAALIGLIAQNWQPNNPAGYPIPQAVQDANLFSRSGCSLDVAWGNALAIVQGANRRTQDLLETIEAASNNREAVALLIQAIPIIETLPIDEFVTLTQQITEWMQEAYFAGYDVDYELERACDIFCMIANSEDCEVSYTQIAEYFINRARLIPHFENVFGTASFIVAALASWTEQTGQVVADVLFGVQFGFLGLLNSAFGVPFERFSMSANSGIPDNDWTINCEDCAQLVVLATTSWEDAASHEGLNVIEGVEYTLTVTGTTSGYGGTPPYDANGIAGSAPVSCFPLSTTNAGQLAGYIQSSGSGDGAWFNIGTGITFTADRSGTLRFAIADGCSGYANNEGELIVAWE